MQKLCNLKLQKKIIRHNETHSGLGAKLS